MASNILNITELASSERTNAIVPVAIPNPADDTNPLGRKVDFVNLLTDAATVLAAMEAMDSDQQSSALTAIDGISGFSGIDTTLQYSTVQNAGEPTIMTRTYDRQANVNLAVENNEIYIQEPHLYLGRIDNSSFLNDLENGTEIIIKRGSSSIRASIVDDAPTGNNSVYVYYSISMINGSSTSFSDGQEVTVTIAEPDDWHTSKTNVDTHARVVLGDSELGLPGYPIGFSVWNDVESEHTGLFSSGDRFLIGEANSGAGYPNKYVTYTNLRATLAVFNVHDDVSTEETSLANDDRIVMSDESVSGEPNRYAVMSNVAAYMLDIHNRLGTELTSIENDDRIPITDESTSGAPVRYSKMSTLKYYANEEGTHIPTITGLESTQTGSGQKMDWHRSRNLVLFTGEILIADTATDGWTIASPIFSMPTGHTNIESVRGTVTAYAGKEKDISKGYFITRRTDGSYDQLVEIDLDTGDFTTHSPGERYAPIEATDEQVYPLGIRGNKGYVVTRRTDGQRDEFLEIELTDGSVTRHSNDENIMPIDAAAWQGIPLGIQQPPVAYSTSTRTTGIGIVEESSNKLKILFEKLERSERDVFAVISGSYRIAG